MLNPEDFVDVNREWFMPKLDRRELGGFLERDNRHALGHFAVWLILLGCLGYLASRLFLASSWWALPAFLCYGIVYSGNNARWHECSHGTCFRSDGWNKFFYWLCGSMEFRDGIEFRWSHARHHSYTMMRTIDPEIPLPRPPKLLKYFADYFYLWSGFYALRNLIMNSLGIVPGMVRNYVPEEEFRAMFNSARLALLPHVLVIILAAALGSWLPILLFGLPRFYGCFVQWTFNGMQHAAMAENEYDHRVSTRSFVLNPVLSFLYINMEYHIEHHLYPLVPWHQLPKLNRAVRAELPVPYHGLLPALAECLQALIRLKKDTSFNIPRPLPDGELPHHDPVTTAAESLWNSGGITREIDGVTWMSAGSVQGIRNEGMVLLRAEDRHIIVYAKDDGFCASDGLCTHEQAPLINGKRDSEIIECPKHNARFHICTGEVLRKPARENLKVYSVREEDGSVFVRVAED